MFGVVDLPCDDWSRQTISGTLQLNPSVHCNFLITRNLRDRRPNCTSSSADEVLLYSITFCFDNSSRRDGHVLGPCMGWVAFSSTCIGWVELNEKYCYFFIAFFCVCYRIMC